MIAPGIAPRRRRDIEIGTQPLIAAGVAKHEVHLTRIGMFPALSTKARHAGFDILKNSTVTPSTFQD
jgi:hypothetical protein